MTMTAVNRDNDVDDDDDACEAIMAVASETLIVVEPGEYDEPLVTSSRSNC